MNVVIQSRAFGADLAPVPVQYSVSRYSHAAIGGPKQAEIAISGSELDLWSMVERLRCSIKIYSDFGDCVWWGYVAEVRLSVGGLTVNVSLDSMYNRVAVAYQDKTTSKRATTSWGENVISNTEYGKKELMYSSSGSNQTHAEAARAALLNQFAFPIPIPQITQGAGVGVGSMLCRGWWDSLDWMYYTNSIVTSLNFTGRNGAGDCTLTGAKVGSVVSSLVGLVGITGDQASGFEKIITVDDKIQQVSTSNLSSKQYTANLVLCVDTATQVTAMAMACGQFLASVNSEVVAGVSIPEDRNGDGTGKAEIEELLKMGTANNRRMLASVDEYRNLRIYEEPTAATPCFINKLGELYDAFGSELRRERCPAGIYARLRDVIPGVVNISCLADPTLMFVEESEYEPATGRLRLSPRGVPNVFDVGKVRDG